MQEKKAFVADLHGGGKVVFPIAYMYKNYNIEN